MGKRKDTSGDRLEDYKAYQTATHEDLMKLTRTLIAMPLGDLVRLHKDKADEFGATAPSPAFIRGVLFSRLANGQLHQRPKMT